MAKKQEQKSYKGYIFNLSEKSQNNTIIEKFNSKVADKIIKWPSQIGVEHPFKFEDMENVYKNVGFVYGMVNRYTHAIIGEFSVKTEDERATKICNDFIKETRFRPVIRDWLVEGFSKGNGFIEVDVNEPAIKVINANNVYIMRDETGKVTGYNQYIGDPSKFKMKEVIPLPLEKIYHLPINQIADEAYGLGLIYPNQRVIENVVLKEQDLQKLMTRKAGAPYHFKVGVPGEAVNSSAIDDIKQSLTYQTNRTEWVTDANVEIKAIDFANLGTNLTATVDHDMLMFSYGTLIAESQMGKGNLPEGLAQVNQDDWRNLISAYQDIVEPIIEKIFKDLLNANGLDVEVEFIWNLPSETEINNRVTQLLGIIGNMAASPALKQMAEIEIARLLNFDLGEDVLTVPTANTNVQAEKERKAQLPVVPGARPNPKQTQKTDLKEKIDYGDFGQMSIKEFINIIEIAGFNYTDYLTAILAQLKIDGFENLVAANADELKMGLFDKVDIDKLRTILSDAFKENKSVAQIEKEIKEYIKPADRLNEKGDLMLSAEARPEMIARTETVRIANEGLTQMYADNGIEKVRWIAALSDRTCPECEALNGQVFEIQNLNSGVNQPPLHPNCRCSLLSVQG